MSYSHPEKNVFQKDLSKLNKIVNDIISDQDFFKNNHYNFLSQDVCQNYKIVLEEELAKHIKLDIKSLGTSLYIIPREENDDAKLTKHHLTKKQVCEKISNHYIKILYIMCLVKYVYNTENSGDLSITGIVFRNIKIVDDLMQIVFCAIPHKNYMDKTKESGNIDFSNLEGLNFFTKYFLLPEDAHNFIGLLRSVLSRSSPKQVAHHICRRNIKGLEEVFVEHFPNNKLSCSQKGGTINLDMFVEKDNPVFDINHCGAPIKLSLKLNTLEGRVILAQYKKMKAHYTKNIEEVNSIINKLVHKSKGVYELKDVDKDTLNNIIDDITNKVKIFYIQSIFDFQTLLDLARKTPNIHIN